MILRPKKKGSPIEKLGVATNANDILARFWKNWQILLVFYSGCWSERCYCARGRFFRWEASD
jgi:hypothetical protein